MSHLMSDQRVARLERFSLGLFLPRLLILGHVAAVGSFGIVIASVIGVMHFASAAPNPFNDYVDIFPGQVLHGLDMHRWSCTNTTYSYYHDPLEIHCNLYPLTGVFSVVSIVYIRGVIHETNFTLRERTMTVADLATLLDVSEIRARRVVLFTWRGYIGTAQIENPSKHFALWRHVWQVTLTNTRLGQLQR